MVVVGVVAAAIVSFVISAVLYATPPVAALVSRTSTPRPGVGVPVQMMFVLLRGLLAATVLAILLVAGDRHGVAAGRCWAPSWRYCPSPSSPAPSSTKTFRSRPRWCT